MRSFHLLFKVPRSTSFEVWGNRGYEAWGAYNDISTGVLRILQTLRRYEHY